MSLTLEASTIFKRRQARTAHFSAPIITITPPDATNDFDTDVLMSEGGEGGSWTEVATCQEPKFYPETYVDGIPVLHIGPGYPGPETFYDNSNDNELSISGLGVQWDGTDQTLRALLEQGIRELDESATQGQQHERTESMWQTIPLQFVHHMMPDSIPEDSPKGNWSFLDDNGRVAAGRNGWIPPIMEEDPDFIRFEQGFKHELQFPPQPRNVQHPEPGPSMPQLGGLAMGPPLAGASQTAEVPATFGQADQTTSQLTPSFGTVNDGFSHFEPQWRDHFSFPVPPTPSNPVQGVVPVPTSGSTLAAPTNFPVQVPFHTGGWEQMNAPPSTLAAPTSFLGQIPFHTGGWGQQNAPPSPYGLLQTPPTAAQLLHNKSGKYRRKFRIPSGLQRIVTQLTVEKLAYQYGVSAPLATDDDVSVYFKWQKGQPVHPVLSHSTPVNVDIRLLGNLRITAAEILTFFPNHLKWVDATYRLVQNGWTPAEITSYVNYVRQLSGDAAEKTSHVRELGKKAEKEITGLYTGAYSIRPRFKTINFTAKTWAFPKLLGMDAQPIDYFLVDLADGVVHWPLFSGAHLFTRVIRFAVDRGYRYVRLSQIHDFIRDFNLRLPLLPAMALMGKNRGLNPDVVVLNELKAISAEMGHRQESC